MTQNSLKEILGNIIKDFNNKNDDFKITYWEVFDNDNFKELSYTLYIEDIKTGVEYQSSDTYSYNDNLDYDIVYNRIMTVLDRDIEEVF
mgnify:CR=1 FL=1